MIRSSLKLLVITLVSMALLEGSSRLLIKHIGYGDFLLGKPWRYVLPFNCSDKKSFTISRDTSQYRRYDPVLGWSLGQWKSDCDMYFSQDRGFRCSRETFIRRKASSNHYDVACIGNSFTHGDAVQYEDTWPYLVERQTHRTIINMGVGGYGIDQAILRFIKSGITCDTVILGMVSGDLERSLSSTYNYYSGGTKTKPKFCFHDSSYSILNIPCITPEEFTSRPASPRTIQVYKEIDGYNNYLEREDDWWAKSAFLRIVFSSIEQRRHKKPPVYLQNDERMTYCLKIIEVLQDHCRENNIVPIVLLIDNINSFQDRKSLQRNSWTVFQQELTKRGIQSINFQDEFYPSYVNSSASVIHPKEKVHYSPEGHKLLANCLMKKL